MNKAGNLGDDLLELGPGPGLTTDLLKDKVARVTAVEVDEKLAQQLADRLAGTNVTVLNADAANTGLDDDRFSSIVSFSMFHHIPSATLQDAVFAEASRVLRTGGRLLVVDSTDSPELREVHLDDTFVPLDPDTLEARLGAAGFADVSIETVDLRVRVVARKAEPA